MKITQKGYFRDFISDFGPTQKNSEKSPVSVKKTRTHSKWVIDGCSHFFLLKHKDVNSGKMNPPEKNFLFGHLSFFYADFHQLNIKIFILTISYNHITGLRILFPVYTFHFLSSSCVCSSEGLLAIWGLPVSESTIFKSQSPSDLWSWSTHAGGGRGRWRVEGGGEGGGAGKCTKSYYKNLTKRRYKQRPLCTLFSEICSLLTLLELWVEGEWVKD